MESTYTSLPSRIKKRTKNDQRTPCRSTQHIRRAHTKKLNTLIHKTDGRESTQPDHSGQASRRKGM